MSNELKFEELQKKLKKVLDTNRFRFIFIFYPHINLREDVKNYICENFIHSNQITLNLKDNSYQNIAPILYENDKSFIFIDDFFDVLDNADLYNGFNQRRDKIASKSINLICFVNSNFKEKFFQISIEYIPDLFEFKNAIFEIEKISNDSNNLLLKEVSSSSYSSLGGLTTQSKKEEVERLLLKLGNLETDEQKLNLFFQITTIYQDMGELKKALEYQEKAMKLTEEILGDKHPDLASSYNNISTIYQDMGELKKALEYQEKAMKLREEILGDKHPDLATSYNNISMIYQDMGELKKALEYQEKNLKLIEEILGDKHPDLATSYNNISIIYKDLKECLKAKEYMQKAVNIWKEYEYYNKNLFKARDFIKEIDYNIKKNKKGRFCKDT